MSDKIRLLIFDWDGTLMDSEARIVACVKAAASDLGLAIPPDEAARDIIGLGLKEAVTRLFPGADDHRITQVAERYRHHFLYQDSTPSELFPGAEGILRVLSEQNYLMAVATGKGRQGLDTVLQSTGLTPLFHATRCADETFSKPHPEMLMQILDELGIEAEAALMIGDTEYDLQMASNAGVRSLAISYGVHPLERLLPHGPLGYLDDIRDLAGWLERLDHLEGQRRAQ